MAPNTSAHTLEDEEVGIAGLPPEQTIDTPSTATALETAPVAPSSVVADGSSSSRMPVFEDRRNKPSRKKWVFLGLGSALLLALLGGGAFAYTQYQKPENVVLDSVTKAMTAHAVQAKMTIKSPYKYETNGYKISLTQLTLNFRGNTDPRYDQAAVLELSVNDKPLKVTGKSLLDSNGDVYFRLDDLEQSLHQTYEILGEQDVPSVIIDALKPIQNKWVRYSIDSYRKNNEAGAKAMTCLLDNYKKYAKDDAFNKEIKKKYEAHQFVRSIDSGTSRDGLSQYEVSIDQDVLKAFTSDIDTTQFAKDLKACSKSGDQDTPITDDYTRGIPGVSTYDSATSEWKFPTKIHLLIEPWTHTLRRIETDTTIKNDSVSTNVTTSTELSYDQVELKAPSDAVNFEEWVKNFENLGTALNDNPPSSVEKTQMTENAKDLAQQAVSAANTYAKKHNGALPPGADIVESNMMFTVEVHPPRVISKAPIDETTVQYMYCSPSEAYVVYKNMNDGHLTALGLGNGRSSDQFNPATACRSKLV